MKMSISVTKRKDDVARVATFYLDEKTIKHIFPQITKVYMVIPVKTENEGQPVAIRLIPLLKEITPPAGVLCASVKPLKPTAKEKKKSYRVEVTIPKAWNLPLTSRTKQNVEFVLTQTEDSLENCIDIPVLKDWIDTAAVSPPAAPPVVEVQQKQEVTITKPLPAKTKIAKPESEVKPIMKPEKKDQASIDALMGDVEKAVGHLNMVLGLLEQQGVLLEPAVKRRRVAVYRFIPARKKRIV